MKNISRIGSGATILRLVTTSGSSVAVPTAVGRKSLSIGLTLLIAFVCCTGRVSADDASDRYNAAKQAFDSKRYDQSRYAFEEFLAKYPSHAQAAEAKFYLAESLLNLQQYDLAISHYNSLKGLGLNNPYARVAMFRLGDIPYVQGQFDVAKPRLEEFVEKLPHDTNLQFVLYYLGDIAMRSGGAAEAEHYFNQSVRMFPTGARFIESQIGLAWAANQLGKQTDANQIYQQLMNSNDPATVEQATYQWGVAQFERGDNQGAVATLTTFLSRWPRSTYYADAQRVLARCKGATGDYNGAYQIVSQIAQPTTEDILLKVRCLYGLNRTQEAQNLLTSIERSAGPAYADEIALLKSVFLFDQQNWQGTIATLEPVLLPQYNSMTGKMMFNYSTMPVPLGGQKLSDESFLKACSLLALAYARSGDTAKANATLSEMQGNAAMIGGADLQAIVAEASNRLSEIYAQTGRPGGNNPPGGSWNPNGNNPSGGGQWNPGGNTSGSGGGQWNPNWNYPGGNAGNNPSGNPGGGRPQNPSASGSDLDRFWQASQFYDQRNWSAAAQQLDQLLLTQYNQFTKRFYIDYNVTGTDGTLNELTFLRACSMLALSRAQLGDQEQANAVLAAFANRARSTDSAQQQLVQQTQYQLTELARTGVLPGGSNPPGMNPGGMIPGRPSESLISDAEQRQILRECNSLYNAKRFDQVETKLRGLIDKRPAEATLTEAMLLRGKTLLELERDRDALAMFDSIVRDYSSSTQYADALWLLGLYYVSFGDSAKSAEYFQLLADQFPNNKNIDGALYFLALDDIEHGNGRTANSNLTRIYRNYQNGKYWSHAAWTLAYEAYKKKDYAQSEIYLQKILQHPPDYAILDRVLYLRGDLALRKKEYDTAFVAFRDVAKLCPESPLRDGADKNAQLASRSGNATR